ncbi:MAG: thioredoxin family protein [Sulfurovaceae bacterium]|nr:thioredoxin family protein [Sulfurovaceae bacterium]MDD5548297.1 thioredoxin family protein [Sulfurovaceae bacterium]
MKIEILGTGCAKCKALEAVVKEAVSKVGGFHEVTKVEDIVEIMKYNVVSTPALVIDGMVKSAGKLLSIDDVLAFINGTNSDKLTKNGCDCGSKC